MSNRIRLTSVTEFTADQLSSFLVSVPDSLPGYFSVVRIIEELRDRIDNDQWQPIDTALKPDFGNCNPIIGWCPDLDSPRGGDQRIVWWEPYQDNGDGTKGAWFGDRDMVEHPTKWRSLPADPK